LVVSVMPNLWLATLLMIPVGFFSINFQALSNSLLQIASTPQMRGRILSLFSIAFLGTTPIGGPIIGWIGEHFGPRWGIAGGGFAAVLAVALVYVLQRRKDKEVKIVAHIAPPTEIHD
jgi:MFS family permease